MICNICGASAGVDMDGFPDSFCSNCHAFIRTRAIKFMLDHLGIIKPGARVMHLSPEPGLYRFIHETVGNGYEAFDFDPERYSFAPTKKLDLVVDCENIPSGMYDLVLHSHVMEHVKCNVTAVLYHLHRAIKPSGWHVMVLPFMPGNYDEYLGTLDSEEATRRFGQFDHTRWFGDKDVLNTVGMVFRLPEKYDLTVAASPHELERAGIPKVYWTGFTGSTVLCFRRGDLKLVERATAPPQELRRLRPNLGVIKRMMASFRRWRNDNPKSV